MNPDEKRHVQQYVGRAKLFIANINQRRQTLFNITRCLVDQQRDFLEHGVRHLRPLAARGRRAAAGRPREHRQPRHGQQVRDAAQRRGDPYAHFFTPSLSVKDIMKEVDRERRQAADRLRDRGAAEGAGHPHRAADRGEVPHAARDPAELAALARRRTRAVWAARGLRCDNSRDE